MATENVTAEWQPRTSHRSQPMWCSQGATILILHFPQPWTLDPWFVHDAGSTNTNGVQIRLIAAVDNRYRLPQSVDMFEETPLLKVQTSVFKRFFSLKEFFLSKDAKGLNITLPHKKSVARIIKNLCDEASFIDAVNIFEPKNVIILDHLTKYKHGS